ncbi:hypothetical protein [Streptomyces rimosus]|uniref:hypothetical protein n=1 Tax=Streptomyces rimosus TaxID=1927 RepID=UPI0006B29945|nr:hypothetical protein [Streptomyces rimosus]
MTAANVALLLGSAGFVLLAYAVHAWVGIRRQEALARRIEVAAARVARRPAAGPEWAFLVGREPLDDPADTDTRPGRDEAALSVCEQIWKTEQGKK